MKSLRTHARTGLLMTLALGFSSQVFAVFYALENISGGAVWGHANPCSSKVTEAGIGGVELFLNGGPVLLPDGGLTLGVLGLAYLSISSIRKSLISPGSPR